MGAAAKVWFDAKDKMYHHENGRTIPAQDIKTLPHHRRAILGMAGLDPNQPITAPIDNETQLELDYVAKLLGGEA